MKHIVFTIIILFATFSYGQEKRIGYLELKKEIKDGNDEIFDFKKPFNFFIAAGVSYRMGSNYGVAISPVDNTVQFQEKPDLHSGISTGLVWTPFNEFYKAYNENKGDWQLEVRKNGFSIALLINIFKLSFNGEQVNSTNPINVGFGLGWKEDDFLILMTYEFTPQRQPRSYFINAYKGKNKTLLLSGTQEPVRTININDDALFYTKLYQSIGIKIAYSFGSKKEN